MSWGSPGEQVFCRARSGREAPGPGQATLRWTGPAFLGIFLTLLSVSPHIHHFSPAAALRGRQEKGCAPPPPVAGRAQAPAPGCWPYVAEGVRSVSRGVDVAGRGRPVTFSSRRVGDDGRLPRVAGAHPDGWKAGVTGEWGRGKAGSRLAPPPSTASCAHPLWILPPLT